MVVFEIGPLGCLPYIINQRKPRTRCDEDANKLASIFNENLKVKLKELGEKLDGSIFVTARMFNLIKSMVEKSGDYGLRETKFPCCATQENGTGLCEPTKIHLLSPKEMAENRPEDRFEGYKRDYLCIESPPPPPALTVQPESSTGKPTGDLCEDRRSFLYWDELHLTKAANGIIVDKCVNANSDGICAPYSINQLVNQR
ncbi:GDSL esterase/lipase At3g50400-like [Rhododendron vialii]|uniref:GDSL esterase/lipase At3g50400-like n=1 Tax=Rhododendron vialii TaxID=182163 RepID=UPI00266021FD|nr:GDSL esterase/lipase At3g50400-like [Rhododendron vialii]